MNLINEAKIKLNEAVRPILYNVDYFSVDADHHLHMCDFDLIYNTRTAHNKCKQYLKSIGKKRDKNDYCCDMCKHMKYLQCSDNDPDDIVAVISPTEEDIQRWEKIIAEYKKKYNR